MDAVEELNYRPNTLAVNLKTGRRQTLALILPSLTDIYYAKLEKYMESYASEKDYIIYLNNTEYQLEKEKQIIDMLIGLDIAGVIIAPATGEHAHIRKLADAGIPYVYLNRNFDDDPAHCIRLDNAKAVCEAVNYMIRLGHRHFGGVFQSFQNSACKEQYDGMMQALNGHGLSCLPDNLLFDINPEELSSVNLLLGMLQRPNRPEVIFACNDMTAFSIYRAAYILGLHIPEQLSVFGYDDCTMANFVTPPLSTVSVPARQIASTAISFIHHYQETGELMELPTLKTSLVIRSSVKNLKLTST